MFINGIAAATKRACGLALWWETGHSLGAGFDLQEVESPSPEERPGEQEERPERNVHKFSAEFLHRL